MELLDLFKSVFVPGHAIKYGEEIVQPGTWDLQDLKFLYPAFQYIYKQELLKAVGDEAEKTEPEKPVETVDPMNKPKKEKASSPIPGETRWVTLHPGGRAEGEGVHVLVRQNPDRTWSVMGGAGGKMSHYRISSLKSPEEYRKIAKEKKDKQFEGLDAEGVKKLREEKRQMIIEKHQKLQEAYSKYFQELGEIIGKTPEEIESLRESAKKQIVSSARKETPVKESAKSKYKITMEELSQMGEKERLDKVVELMKNDPEFKGWKDEEIKARAFLAIEPDLNMRMPYNVINYGKPLSVGIRDTAKHIKNIREAAEQKALESIIGEPGVSQEYLENGLDLRKLSGKGKKTFEEIGFDPDSLSTEQAHKIIQADNKVKQAASELRQMSNPMEVQSWDLESIGFETPESKKLGELESQRIATDKEKESFLNQLPANVRNEFDKIKEQILQKHIQNYEVELNKTLYSELDKYNGKIGSVLRDGALNGLNTVAFKYMGVNAVSKQMIDFIGAQNTAKLFAAYAIDHGYKQQMLEGLEDDILTENIKTVQESLVEARKQDQIINRYRALQRDPETPFSVAQLNGYILQAVQKKEIGLGLSQGALESRATVFNHLKGGKIDELSFVGGTNPDVVEEKMKALGLEKDDYSMKADKNTVKVIIPKYSFGKLFNHTQKVTFTRDQAIADIKNGKHEFSDPKWKPEGFTAPFDLTQEQRDGLAFADKQKNCILAYDPGIGKTAMAAAYHAHAKNKKEGGRTLFITKSGAGALIDQNAAEIKNHLKNENIYKVREKKDLAKAIGKEGDKFVLMSHDSIRNYADLIKHGDFDRIIVDEAHEMFTPGVKQSSGRGQKLLDISDRFNQRIAMSGSVVRNELTELAKMANFVQPNKVDINEFSKRYKVIDKSSNTFQQQAVEAMRSELDDVLIRGKLSNASKLNESYFNAEPTTTQKKAIRKLNNEYSKIKKAGAKYFYPNETPTPTQKREARNRYRSYVSAHRLKIKDILNDGEAATNGAFQKLVADIKAGKIGNDKKKLIIFTQYNTAADMLHKGLGDEFGKHNVTIINEDVSAAQRNTIRDKFNTTGEMPQFLIVMPSAQTGLSFHKDCNNGLMWQLPPTYAAKRQSQARILRKGGTFKDVNISNLTHHLPTEDREEEIINRKQKLYDAIGNPSNYPIDDTGTYDRASGYILEHGH